MKKIAILMGLLFLVVAMSGCKKPVETDIYDDVTLQQEQQVEDDGLGTGPEVVEELVDEPPTTVTEEVYDNTNELISEAVEVEPMVTNVDDPEFEASLMTYIDDIYYNMFFGEKGFEEGFTADDMTKFGVSYIYQHEYNELKFDSEAFVLYVPEKRVQEIVLKYFDHRLMNHQSYIEDNLMYDEGYYLMPAVDAWWGEDWNLEFSEVKVTGDFTYSVQFFMDIEGDENHEPVYYRADVEVRDDRFVLVSYIRETPMVDASEGATTN